MARKPYPADRAAALSLGAAASATALKNLKKREAERKQAEREQHALVREQVEAHNAKLEAEYQMCEMIRNT